MNSSYFFDAPCGQDQCVTSPDSGQYGKTADQDQVGVAAAGRDQVGFVPIQHVGTFNQTQQLQQFLTTQYTSVERLISLRRRPHTVDAVKALLPAIEQSHQNLMQFLVNEVPVNLSAIECANRNKDEFDTRVNEWLATESPAFDTLSDVSNPSTRSFRSSVILRVAELKASVSKLALLQIADWHKEEQELIALRANQARQEAALKAKHQQQEAQLRYQLASMELKALANQVDSLNETDGPPHYKTLMTPLLETHDSSAPMDSIANFPSTFETKHPGLAGFDLNVEPKVSIACDVAPHVPDSSVSFPEFTSQHLPTLLNETPFFSAQVHPTPSRAVPVCATQTTATLPRSERYCESRPRVRFSKAYSCHGTQCGSTQVHMKLHVGTQQLHPMVPSSPVALQLRAPPPK